MFSLADLIVPVTRDEMKASIYRVLGIVGVNTTSWKPGAVVRTVITACAIVFSAFSQLIALIAQSGFLDYSTGDWLTLLARYVYGVERIAATFATGEVTLVNAGGGVYNVDPDDLIVSNPTTGKTYRNVSSFALGAFGTVVVPVLATEQGQASTSAPGTITAFETPLVGVTVTNATSVVGTDTELDPDLRIRCREKLGALSPNGPWDAYSFTARSAVRADGSTIGVTRVRTIKDGYGNVTVFVGTPTGGVTGDADDVTTDLGKIHDDIQRSATPICVTETTESAVVHVVPITYTQYVYNTSGLSEAAIKAANATALTLYLSKQPIGGNVVEGQGWLYNDALRSVIAAARPETFHVVVSGADVELAASEVPVAGAIVGTVVQVAPREGTL